MRLNQVTVYSGDVARAADFYRRLGLTQIVENYPDYARFLCPDGEATFSVERHEDRPDRPSAAVFFECDDVDGEVARLKFAGFVFESDPEDKRWLWREAALADPDGNRIVLYHAGKNRTDPPWRLPESR
jgi:catechol 2,3-dioxygenase-like lactoylglutathione lyase family enzyme